MKMNTWMDNAAVAAVIAAILFNVLHGVYLNITEEAVAVRHVAEVSHV